MTSRTVLCQVIDSKLASIFDGSYPLKEIDGSIFLDRNGEVFANVLDYLRSDRKQWPQFTDANELRKFKAEL